MTSTSNELDARERILRAASELFYAQGIAASGVDSLIERANVAKATFYRHFPSKDDLVLAWLRGPDARWLDWVVPELERLEPSPLARLPRFWEVAGEWVRQHDFGGCPYLNILVEVRDYDDPARDEVRSYIQEVEAYFSRTAAAAGLPTPEEFARRMRYIAMAFFMAIRLERSTEPIDTSRRSTIGLLALWLETTPKEVEDRIAAG